jgi:hypothetical protein
MSDIGVVPIESPSSSIVWNVGTRERSGAIVSSLSEWCKRSEYGHMLNWSRQVGTARCSYLSSV